MGLYLLSPFYLMNAASYFSHVLPALLIALVCLCCLRYQRDRRIGALVAAGVLLGCIGLTRYFTLVLILPALAYWFFSQPRREWLRIMVVMASAGAPFLAFLLIYQYWVTGSPFHSTYSLISTDDTSLSFAPQNVALGARLFLQRFLELFLWSAPLLVPVYLLCLVSKIRTRSIAFYDLIFPLFVLGYIFFADLGGNRYGPRYYFDALPMLFATMMSVASRSDAAVSSRRPFIAHVVLASALYLVTAWPFMLVAYHRQIVQREEPYRLARSQGLENAIVIIQESSSPGLDDVDLARNDETLESSILYARRGTALSALQGAFPDRAIWAYVREDLHRPGWLDLVATGQGGAR